MKVMDIDQQNQILRSFQLTHWHSLKTKLEILHTAHSRLVDLKKKRSIPNIGHLVTLMTMKKPGRRQPHLTSIMSWVWELLVTTSSNNKYFNDKVPSN